MKLLQPSAIWKFCETTQVGLGSAVSWLTQEGRSVLQAALQAHRCVLPVCILLQRRAVRFITPLHYHRLAGCVPADGPP